MDRMTALKELEYVVKFSEIYMLEDDIYLREAKCLKLQSVNMLVPIVDGDIIAGRMNGRYIGFSPQYCGLYTYFYHEEKVCEALKTLENSGNDELVNKINELNEFWLENKTMNRLSKRFEDKFGFVMPNNYQLPGVANADGRVAGNNVDLDKLVRLGLCGLHDEVDAKEKQNENKDEQTKNFYTAMHMTIDTIADACEYYKNQALEQAKTADEVRKLELLDMAEVLENNKTRAPKSFKEGLQLFWIYSVISDLMNYGRMDVYLGDLYVNDLKSGAIDEEIAIKYLTSLYTHFIRIGKIHDCRVLVGGKGRRNEENADKLAIIIMETSRRVHETVPQLTYRYYKGGNEKLFDKALEVNAEGCTFPIIYSDDTNIPAVMKAYGVTEEEAQNYLPFGCGEYVLEGLSTGTPNNGVNMLKALEVTLNNGVDPFFNSDHGLRTGEVTEFDTFDKLWDAFTKQLEPWIQWVAWHKKFNYDVAKEQAGYLHMSLLMNDCIQRGKGMLNGGVRYENAASEVFGIISCADSLTAIKKYVYDDKVFTLKEVADMISKNFEGYEKERQMLIKAPKYGNDTQYADDIAQKVFNHVAHETIKWGKIVGLNKYLIVSVNNSMSAEWGGYCGASACGRLKGTAMSNGNGASIGGDKNGVTALLNSMAKFDPTIHVGVIHNVRFTKELFKSSYDKIKMALRTFYENNGVQTNITAIGKEDLENAVKNPEKYQNLIVRIGGFSARFVQLSPIVQAEILARTTYNS